jgi:hypothetical protein
VLDDGQQSGFGILPRSCDIFTELFPSGRTALKEHKLEHATIFSRGSFGHVRLVACCFGLLLHKRIFAIAAANAVMAALPLPLPLRQLQPQRQIPTRAVVTGPGQGGPGRHTIGKSKFCDSHHCT